MSASSKRAGRFAADNRKALRDYAVLEKLEAGIELQGCEVKSIREGRVDLTGGFAMERDGEMVLCDVHISPYEFGSHFNPEPDRQRRLLLRKRQIRSLADRVAQNGLAIIPLNFHITRGWVKVELGLCKGKKTYDKRDALRRKTAMRETERAVRRGG